MGKKKYIDKKTSAHFRLVYRESNDSSSSAERIFLRTDEGSNFVPGFSEDYPLQQPHQMSSTRDDGSAVEGPESSAEPPVDAYSEEEDCEEYEEYEDDDYDYEDAGVPAEAGEKGNGCRGRTSSRSKAEESGRQRSRLSSSSSRSRSVYEAGFRGGNERLNEAVRREIIEMGFPDDGYDYTKHLRTIGAKTNLSSFIPSLTPQRNLKPDVKVYDSRFVQVARNGDAENELSTNLEYYANKGVAKHYATIDEDVMAALENSEGSDNDLEDDFVVFANSESDNFSKVEACDANRLIGEVANAKIEIAKDEKGNRKDGEIRKEEKGGIFSDASEDDSYIEEKEKRKETNEKGGGDQVGKMLDTEAQLQNYENSTRPFRPKRLIDEQFEELALREYNDDDDDDDDGGEFEDNYGDANHSSGLEISNFNSIMDDEFEKHSKEPISLGEIRNVLCGNYKDCEKKNIIYINEKDEIVNDVNNGDDGAHHPGVGGGMLNKTKEKHLKGMGSENLEGERGDKAEGEQSEEKGKGEEIKHVIKKLYEFVIPEDEVNDEMEIVEVGDDEELFDCESIISTYSNLDNHPGRIVDDGSRGRRRGEERTIKEGIIELSGKKNLPLSFLVERGKRVSNNKTLLSSQNGFQKLDAEKYGGGTSSKAHGRTESPEEKRLRKAAVKEERRNARIAKKNLRMTYTSESKKGQVVAARSTPQGLHLN